MRSRLLPASLADTISGFLGKKIAQAALTLAMKLSDSAAGRVCAETAEYLLAETLFASRMQDGGGGLMRGKPLLSNHDHTHFVRLLSNDSGKSRHTSAKCMSVDLQYEQSHGI